MQENLFEKENKSPGFRLHRLELLNWGTFHNKIWKIEPTGLNSLLTGDIGSGKSTIVDAITTLFIQHNRIVYNKAAGAEGKERNLLTYIRGEYKNEKNIDSGSSKPVYLRSENSYSVVLAFFYNEVLSQSVTLANVFWTINNEVEKFFIVSSNNLTIQNDFINFGTEMLLLRKKLRTNPSVEIFDNFKEYTSRFRNIFGVKSEKAFDLFYQTISMKSVGNLTEFVRNHMLEKSEVKEKIEELKKNYENLTIAHNAVQKAKSQLEELGPIVTNAEELYKVEKKLEELIFCIDKSELYFSIQKISLLDSKIQADEDLLSIYKNQLAEMKEVLERFREAKEGIRIALNQNTVSQRIAEIENQLKLLHSEQKRKIRSSEEYILILNQLGIAGEIDESRFYSVSSQMEKNRPEVENQIVQLNLEKDNLTISSNKLLEQIEKEKIELDSLLQRKTSIPEINLNIRNKICKDLELPQEELPFIGELLQIKKSESEWEGAIERLLHNYGLSILVAEKYYKRVNHYINSTDLKGKIVYYRVTESNKKGKGFNSQNIKPNSIFYKLEIKDDTAMYDWLEKDLIEKYSDFSCCETLEEFQREIAAITKQGLVKSGKIRHEKDDRKNIFDRRYYILGWSNQEKIKAIQKEIKQLTESQSKVKLQKEQIEKGLVRLRERETSIRDLLRFKDYSEINYKKDVIEIQQLNEEKEKLKSSSEAFNELHRQLTDTTEKIKLKEEEVSQKDRLIGNIENSIHANKKVQSECIALVNLTTKEDKEKIEILISPYIKNSKINLDTISSIQSSAEKKLSKQKDEQLNTAGKLSIDITKAMQHYKDRYPAETTEVDATIKSIPEFKDFYKKLNEEDLPRHEERFKNLLNEGTIHDISMFKNLLESQAKDIEEKIKQINISLKEIEYNPGTYIELLTDRAQDRNINDFKSDLRNCLESVDGERDLYNEEKFIRVTKILDKFKSGDKADIDWTTKVTDVKNWFTFSVSEKWKEDNSEKEFYSDSSGKSGGQKEKLAYTILASALAYQFGLEWNQKTSRSFRFVVIDEAFGRGSDESTRYGLNLFEKLNLQLLIVTPLQKINVIEDYVNSVHFVSNTTGDNSMVRNLTIKEYKEEKEEYYSNENSRRNQT